MIQNLFDVLGISNEITTALLMIRNLAIAVGKVFAIIIGIYLAPFIGMAILLVGIFKLFWGILQPILSRIIDIVGWITDGIVDPFVWLFNNIF